jgi:hypothetical protein
MTIQHVFTNAIPDGTNTQIVRPSDWNSAHVLASTIAGNTAGQSTVSGTNIVLAGGANITLSANGSTVSIVGGVGGGLATHDSQYHSGNIIPAAVQDFGHFAYSLGTAAVPAASADRLVFHGSSSAAIPDSAW